MLAWLWSSDGTDTGGSYGQLAESTDTPIIICGRPTRLTAHKLYYSSNILFLLALASSKASIASLLLRLCADKRQKRFFIGALASNGLWLVSSIFAIALQCNIVQPWILVGGQCDGLVGKPCNSLHLKWPADLCSYFVGKSSAGWI